MREYIERHEGRVLAAWVCTVGISILAIFAGATYIAAATLFTCLLVGLAIWSPIEEEEN